MRKERKHYTAEEKVAILRRHLLDKVPVSDLCEELGLQSFSSDVTSTTAASSRSSQPSSRGGASCGIGVIRRLRITLVYLG